MKTVIMAGGRGSRLAELTENTGNSIPKPMIPIEGKPLLERTVDCLREQGFTDLILTVGWRRQAIMRYFGDGSGDSPATGRAFGVHISYFEEHTPMGNAGALVQLADSLKEDFLLLNGDLVFDVDLNRFLAFHREKGGLASLLVHPNDHPSDSGLIETDAEGRVIRWLTREEERPSCSRNQVNAGIHLISPRLLDAHRPDAVDKIPPEPIDLDRDLLKPLAGTGQLFAYRSPEYVKDCGTPVRYGEICRDWRRGLAARRSLRHRQRAVFLDRDGTLNRHVGFLKSPEEIELLPGAARAVRMLNRAGWLVILVTNQPVVARGEVTEDELRAIHGRLETLLGQNGAWLDDIYYCPHHTDRGFPGERPELKIECACRKPRPGMLLQAAGDYSIDLEHSWMAGDRESDVAAGRAAGCRTALLWNGAEAPRRLPQESRQSERLPPNCGQTVTCRDLQDFVLRLLEETQEENGNEDEKTGKQTGGKSEPAGGTLSDTGPDQGRNSRSVSSDGGDL